MPLRMLRTLDGWGRVERVWLLKAAVPAFSYHRAVALCLQQGPKSTGSQRLTCISKSKGTAVSWLEEISGFLLMIAFWQISPHSCCELEQDSWAIWLESLGSLHLPATRTWEDKTVKGTGDHSVAKDFIGQAQGSGFYTRHSCKMLAMVIDSCYFS